MLFLFCGCTNARGWRTKERATTTLVKSTFIFFDSRRSSSQWIDDANYSIGSLPTSYQRVRSAQLQWQRLFNSVSVKSRRCWFWFWFWFVTLTYQSTILSLDDTLDPITGEEGLPSPCPAGTSSTPFFFCNSTKRRSWKDITARLREQKSRQVVNQYSQ